MASKSCDLCLKLHKKSVPAVKSCVECENLLCFDCAKHHKTSKATKAHKLVDISVKTSLTSLSEKIADLKCPLHSSKEIEHFCVDHDVLCCQDCNANDHNACEKVLPVESVSTGVKQSESFKQCEKGIKHILEAFDDILESEEQTKENISKDFQSLRQKIAEIKLDIVKRATEIENELLMKVARTEQEILREIQANTDEVHKEKEIVASHLKEFKLVKDMGNDKQAFLLSKHLTQLRGNCENTAKNIAANLKEFTVNFDRTPDLLTSVKSFGELTTVGRQKEIAFEFLQQKQAQNVITSNAGKEISSFDLSSYFEIKGFSTGINSIAATRDDKILLMEHNLVVSSKILVLSSKGQFIGSVKIASVPKDICTIPDSDSAIVSICSWTKSCLQFINTKSISVEKTLTLPVWEAKGIAATKTEIVLGSNNVIYVIDYEGELLRKFNVNAESIKFIKMNKQGECLYMFDGALYSQKTDDSGEKEKIIYKYDKFSSSGKFDLDDHANLFYLPKGSKKISKLQIKPRHQGIYSSVNKVNMPEPKFVAFNSKFTKVFVANGIGHVAVYRCK